MIYLIIYLTGVLIMSILITIVIFKRKELIPDGILPVMIASCSASWLTIIAILVAYWFGSIDKDGLVSKS